MQFQGMRREGERGGGMSALTSEAATMKPQAVCIPFPIQSHIKVMLIFAKLLHHKGFHITFVNTEFNHKRLLKSRGPNSLDGLPDFRFETIPDGLPSSDPDASQHLPSVTKACKNNLLAPFLDLINTIVPPPTCIVADTCMSFTYAAGEELGIPVISLCTISACSLMEGLQYRPLLDKGYVTQLKDPSNLSKEYLDTILDSIPGMNIIRLRDLSSLFKTGDPDGEWLFNFTMEVVELATTKAFALIINTFDDLERDPLETLAPSFRRIHAIGPIHLLLDQIPEESPIKSIGSNLWKEESYCLQWLDAKKPNSVIYVNFGSIAVATPDQITEMAWGLAESYHNFLWVIRSDQVAGGESSVLPPEFEKETKDRAFIASWCPQEEVLNHGSIRVFLTHNGWNSTLESMSSGVPMICWPFYGDQTTNCRDCCSKWKVGIEIEGGVKREDLKRIVKEVMEGEEGKRMKERVMELKKLAHEAASPNGASSINLDKVVNQVILNVEAKY